MIKVLCHGSFRYPHIGHLRHFQEAKALGDMLIVTITADKYLAKPCHFNERDRADFILSLKPVDDVHIIYEKTGASAIRLIKPDFYVKGIDYAYTGVCDEERAACYEVGAKIWYTGSAKHSSTDVIRMAA